MSFPAVIDNTMRKAFVECPQRFARRHVENLRPSAASSVDLVFGGAFAKGVEVARKRFYVEPCLVTELAIEEGIAAAVAEYGDFQPPAVSYKTKARLVGALRYYFEQWPLGADGLTPVDGGIEYMFNIELPLQHPDTEKPLQYAGRFDMLATDTNGRYYVVDEKTTSRLGDSWVAQWDLDAQMTGYIWAARFKTPAESEILAQVRGISILKNDYGHVEIPVVRSAWMIKRWYEQLFLDVLRMVECYQLGRWDFALGNACVPYGRACDYAMLCKSPNPERLIEGNYKIEVWNPLERV